MERLATLEELAAAEEAFSRVFDRPRGPEPFSAALPCRALIYPLDYTALDQQQLGALAAAAASVGETSAYVAGFGETGSRWGGTYDHRVLDLGDPADYRGPDGPMVEHVLFSPTGTWGVATSDVGYAVAAGPEAFTQALAERLTRAEDAMLWSMLADYLDIPGAETDWVPRLLVHLRGPDEGARLWEQAQRLRPPPGR